jgi:hypothetical protein
MNENENKNENITAVDRRRTGRKRAVAVAFSALAGAVLTILSPGLTSSASALTVEERDTPGDAYFVGAPLTAELDRAPDGSGTAVFRTGKVVLGRDLQSSQGQKVITTYTLQAWPVGASWWQDVESKTVVTAVGELFGPDEVEVPRVAFTPKKGGTPTRYRLVTKFEWTWAYNGEYLSVMYLNTANERDYRCSAPRLPGRDKSISCGVMSVGNSYSIALG